MDKHVEAELLEGALDIARELYGDRNSEVLRGLAALHLHGILHKNTGDESENFKNAAKIAAAYLALASLLKGKHAVSPTSFRAGDVSISVQSAADAAAAATALGEEARAILSPFLCDTSFLFRGVNG